MVEKLLAELGTENSGFTLENVMTVSDTFIHMIRVAAASGIQTQSVLRAKNGRSFSHISTFKPIHQIWADITPSITISAFSTIAVIYKLPLELPQISSCAKCSITWKSLDHVEITIWLIQSSWCSVTIYSVSNYSDGMKEALCHESVLSSLPYPLHHLQAYMISQKHIHQHTRPPFCSLRAARHPSPHVADQLSTWAAFISDSNW